MHVIYLYNSHLLVRPDYHGGVEIFVISFWFGFAIPWARHQLRHVYIV
jgi:hypothetical protein